MTVMLSLVLHFLDDRTRTTVSTNMSATALATGNGFQHLTILYMHDKGALLRYLHAVYLKRGTDVAVAPFARVFLLESPQIQKYSRRLIYSLKCISG